MNNAGEESSSNHTAGGRARSLDLLPPQASFSAQLCHALITAQERLGFLSSSECFVFEAENAFLSLNCFLITISELNSYPRSQNYTTGWYFIQVAQHESLCSHISKLTMSQSILYAYCILGVIKMKILVM